MQEACKSQSDTELWYDSHSGTACACMIAQAVSWQVNREENSITTLGRIIQWALKQEQCLLPLSVILPFKFQKSFGCVSFWMLKDTAAASYFLKLYIIYTIFDLLTTACTVACNIMYWYRCIGYNCIKIVYLKNCEEVIWNTG